MLIGNMISTKDKQLLKYIYAFLSTTRKQGKRMLLGNDRWTGVICSLPTVFHVQTAFELSLETGALATAEIM
jgi:hypothetical protein